MTGLFVFRGLTSSESKDLVNLVLYKLIKNNMQISRTDLSEKYMIYEGLDELNSSDTEYKEIVDEKNVIQIGERVNSEDTEYYINNSKLIVEDILFQNAQNILSNKDISELFELADMYKNNGEYEKANEIFGILLDYSIHNRNSGIERIYETDNYCDEVFEADYNYYYDLAVLMFEGQYLNIPLPLLSKEAVKIFFSKGIDIIDRKDHRRETSKNNEEITELNEKYENIDPNKAPWLLISDDDEFHVSIEDLI